MCVWGGGGRKGKSSHPLRKQENERVGIDSILFFLKKKKTQERLVNHRALRHLLPWNNIVK